MAAPARPRFLFEPGHVRVGARGLGGIKQGGGTGPGGGGKGGGPAKGGGQGKGRGQAATLANFGQLVSAFGAIASSRGVVPSPPDVAGALTLISTTTLASPGTFDVSGISGAYNDLMLVIVVRGTDVGITDQLYLRFNNDSGANYAAVQNTGNSGVAQSNQLSGMTGGRLFPIPAAAALASSFSSLQCTIPGYASTTWLKTGTYAGAASSTTAGTGQYASSGGILWNSTAAITRVQLLAVTTANLATGSQLRIYGIT